MNVHEAYATCEVITRREAKNFSYGIRLLPPRKRRAMSALYAYARRIDDIADSTDPVEEKLTALAGVDAQVGALATGELPDDGDAVLVGVHHAAAAFDIPIIAFSEIVEGCRRDSVGFEYITAVDTEKYCRLVAGSVGRLSLGVFGSAAPEAPELADDLGVALQLTNILRDVVEDRQMGRCYLPRDDVDRFGCRHELDGPPEAMRELVAHEVAAAEEFYRRGLRLLPLLDRRSRACVAAMAGIYRQLLRGIATDPLAITRGRMSLSTPEKLRVAARGLAGLAP
jgi:15-cis-phytoene synthase